MILLISKPLNPFVAAVFLFLRRSLAYKRRLIWWGFGFHVRKLLIFIKQQSHYQLASRILLLLYNRLQEYSFMAIQQRLCLQWKCLHSATYHCVPLVPVPVLGTCQLKYRSHSQHTALWSVQKCQWGVVTSSVRQTYCSSVILGLLVSASTKVKGNCFIDFRDQIEFQKKKKGGGEEMRLSMGFFPSHWCVTFPSSVLIKFLLISPLSWNHQS